MDDVERLIRDSLQEGAGRAPSSVALLAGVHARSRRLARRRRLATGAAALAVVAVAAGLSPLLTSTGGRPRPSVGVVAAPASGRGTGSTGAGSPSGGSRTPPAAVGEATATSLTPPPSGPATPPVPVPASGPSRTGVPASALRFTDGPVAAAVTPFRLGGPIAARMRPSPVVSLDGGAVSSAYEAIDPEGDADIRLTVSSTPPAFPASAAPVRDTEFRVRGHAGRLRTEEFRPTAQLTLYWQERAGQWIQLHTDDTYTPEQVAGFADDLTGEPLAGVLPFRFGLTPAGTAVTTMTDGTVAFTAPDAASPAVVVTLLTRRSVTGTPVRVGTSRAGLSRTAAGTVLLVDDPDRGGVLSITVARGYPVTDADLVRFAAAIRITDLATPANAR